MFDHHCLGGTSGMKTSGLLDIHQLCRLILLWKVLRLQRFAFLEALRFAVFDGPKVRLMKVLIVQNKINMY